MKKTVVFLACSCLIIASGLAYGILTDRWTNPADIENAVRRFEHFPLDLGDWKGAFINEDSGKGSGLAACVSVRYYHQQSGKKVTVFFGCGRPRNVSIHTPDVCYAASGFDVDPQSTESFLTSNENKPGKVLTARFKKTKGAEQTLLRIYWTWCANNEWTVSDNPRIQYSGQKILYKLYVLHELENLSEPPSAEVCLDLLPKLTKALEKSVILTSQ